MGLKGIEGVEHEQCGGDRAHARILESHAAGKKSQTAECSQRNDGQTCGQRACRGPPNVLVVLIPLPGIRRPGMGRFAMRNAIPIKYFGSG